MSKARQQARNRKIYASIFFTLAALIALKLLFVGVDTSGAETVSEAMGMKVGSYISPIFWAFIGVVFWNSAKGKELEAESEEASTEKKD